MTMVGLCVGHRVYLPAPHELTELGILHGGWLRFLAYDLDAVDVALNMIPTTANVCLVLNTETAGVGADWSGWDAACARVARDFPGRVQVVESGNELDIWHWNPPDGRADPRLTPAFAADLARRAAVILSPVGIKTAATSVAGPRWIDYLKGMVQAGLDGVSFVALHPYGQSIDGHPPNWGFGDMRFAVNEAAAIGKRPVAVTESGIKIGEAGGADGQAEYVRRWVELYRSLPPDICAFACYFAGSDLLGTPREQGDFAFGLLRRDGSRRSAYEAFATANQTSPQPHSNDSGGVIPPEVVTVPATKYVVGTGVLARMQERSDTPATDEIYHNGARAQAQYSETFGKSGTRYVYVFETNQTLTFLPDQAA